jgi:hypothetical protein
MTTIDRDLSLSARYTGLPAHLLIIAAVTILALGIGCLVRSRSRRRRDRS